MFAFKPIDRHIRQWAKRPLYEKYAELLEESLRLPCKILTQEASSCADFFNSLEKPLNIGTHTVKALSVHSVNQSNVVI